MHASARSKTARRGSKSSGNLLFHVEADDPDRDIKDERLVRVGIFSVAKLYPRRSNRAPILPAGRILTQSIWVRKTYFNVTALELDVPMRLFIVTAID